MNAARRRSRIHSGGNPHATAEDETALAYNMRKALKADPESKTFFARDVVFDPYRAKPWFIELVGETLAK